MKKAARRPAIILQEVFSEIDPDEKIREFYYEPDHRGEMPTADWIFTHGLKPDDVEYVRGD